MSIEFSSSLKSGEYRCSLFADSSYKHDGGVSEKEEFKRLARVFGDEQSDARVARGKMGPFDTGEGHRLKGRLATDA